MSPNLHDHETETPLSAFEEFLADRAAPHTANLKDDVSIEESSGCEVSIA